MEFQQIQMSQERGLQKLLVPMLITLFERDPRRVWTFDRFFQETDDILSLEPITYLTLFPHHSPFDKLYLPQLQSIGELKQALGELWKKPNSDLRTVLYQGSCLSDWIQDDEQVYDMPHTDTDTPLIPLPADVTDSDGGASIPEPSMVKIMSEELSFTGTSISDLNVAKEMCGIVALINRRTTVLAAFQQHLLSLTHKLRCELRRDMAEVKKTFHLTMEMFDVIKGTANMGSWSQQETHNFKQVTEKMSIVEERLQSAGNAVKLPFEDAQWNFDGKKCMKQTQRASEEAESWLRELVQFRKTVEKARYSTDHMERCQEAVKSHLQAVYKEAVSLWSGQCFQRTTLLRNSFLDWYKSYLQVCNEVAQCQEHLSSAVSLLTQLFKVGS
ncbi:hypothetical protein BaRGS_00005358 [Batillaria attramentaria]|uniref:Uncharacterized protein n=1 Tax=Batillaria attramentaria TaxID=370345 RepID=A0ABD0LVP3_9CAEN